MSGPIRIDDLLQMLSMALIGGVIGRLVIQRLVTSYVPVIVYLLGVALQGVVPWLVDHASLLYVRLYMLSEGAWICVSAFVVLDMYGRVLRGLPGLASVGRSFVRWALLLSAALSLSLLHFERLSSRPLVEFLVVERVVTTCLLVLVFTITGFLSYYPVELGRNTIIYTIGYATLFTARAAGLLLLNSEGSVWVSRLNLLFPLIDCACLTLWAVMLTAEGEKKRVRFGHQWRREDEQKLLRQLESLNESLLRVAKSNNS
jgi:hypothetical protein